MPKAGLLGAASGEFRSACVIHDNY